MYPTLENDDFYTGVSTVNRYKTGPCAPCDDSTSLCTSGDVFGVLYKGVNSGDRWVANPYVQVSGPAL